MADFEPYTGPATYADAVPVAPETGFTIVPEATRARWAADEVAGLATVVATAGTIATLVPFVNKIMVGETPHLNPITVPLGIGAVLLAGATIVTSTNLFRRTRLYFKNRQQPVIVSNHA